MPLVRTRTQNQQPSEPPAKTPAYAGQPISKVNLILEGGAMRALFTAGVLDFFMDKNLWCEHVLGTSAGALCGMNYVAGDVGRTCYLNTKYCDDPRYLSLNSFVLTGDALGNEFAFHTIPEKLEPFDYASFSASPMSLTTVASDLETGEADYHTLHDLTEHDDVEYLRASASMPLVSRTVEVQGKKLLDGGPCDSIALLHSMLMGTTNKHIVVLTQAADYVKGPEKTMPLMRRRYADYPLFLDRIEHRHFEYNRARRWIFRLHEQGEIFAIVPPEPVGVSNMEKDPAKLFALYEQGLAEAARQWDALQAYLEK